MIGQTVAGLELMSAFEPTRAWDLYFGECKDGRCLVKVLRPALAGHREQVDRMLELVRKAGALDHKGIEFVIEAGWYRDSVYMLGDIVPGTSAATLAAKRAAPPETVQSIVRLAADGLAAAHALGIYHHALEPLLLHVGFASDRVIVRDLGLAELTRATAEPGTFVPAASYRAPELWDATTSASATGAADVYALGCIAFELVCTTPPFIVDTVAEAAEAHRTAVPPSARAVVITTPGLLDGLIARMLAKDPAARPTMLEVRDELGGVRRPPATAIATFGPPSEPPPNPVSPSTHGLASWLCDRCGNSNAVQHAFCVHCSGTASTVLVASTSTSKDLRTVMSSLASDFVDEITPPPPESE